MAARAADRPPRREPARRQVKDEREAVTEKREEPVPAITTVAEYTGQSAIRVAATQLGPRYSGSDAKRIVAEWVEFFASAPSAIQDLELVSRTPFNLLGRELSEGAE